MITKFVSLTILQKWDEIDTSINSYNTLNNKKIISIEEFNSVEFICGDEEGKIYR